jgi:hypothetical protein
LVEPALGFPREYADAQVAASIKIDGAPIQHR